MPTPGRPTFTQRLWCVMEIFTFLRMGGARERIELRLIARPDQNQAAAEEELAGQLGVKGMSGMPSVEGMAKDASWKPTA